MAVGHSGRGSAEPTPSPFAGGGAMGERMAALDWSATALGPVEHWSPSLRTTVNLCLSSRAPMMMVWGTEHTQIYNDALAPLMGPKHPAALGRPYPESFPEIWDAVMAPLVTAVHERGESSYLEDLPVSFHRHVPREEMFWTFSWSALREADGRVAGALHPAVETTGRVLAERRLAMLRDLAASVGRATQVEQACEQAVDVLTGYALDVPFAAVYLLDGTSPSRVPPVARLAAAGGLADVAAVFPAEVDLTDASSCPWPLAAAAAAPDQRGVVAEVDVALTSLLGWPWPEPPTTGVVLPLFRPGQRRASGLLAVGASPRRPMDAAQRSFLQLLAGQLSSALATAELHEQQHRVAAALQEALLPRVAAHGTALEVATRYLPGVVDTQVGGDWVDVLPLGAGRTALVIGDVMGRGVRAAAVMGQLSAAVRAYAQLDLPPGRVLDLLDEMVEHVGDAQGIGQIVTCVYAVHDEAAGTLTLANAGHPPAVVLGDAGVHLWQGPVGPPLGTGWRPYPQSSAPLAPGQGVLLYTDGLVEQRDSDLDAGIARLLAAAGAAGGAAAQDLELLADAALAVQGRGQRDDVALLAMRMPLPGSIPAVEVDLREDHRAARTGRREALAALSAWGLDARVVDHVALVTAELVTNALTHTGGVRRLRVRRLGDGVVVEVADDDPRPPRLPHAGPWDERGRGLRIVASLADAWGVRHTGTGKVVWCRVNVPAPPVPASRRPDRVSQRAGS